MPQLLPEYRPILERALSFSGPADRYLFEELPYFWIDLYKAQTLRRTNICEFEHGTFTYVFDDYATLEAMGEVEPDAVSESRLIGAIGYARPSVGSRRDSRLRGWVGPTQTSFGAVWDKGHFIAHSIGGAVDGIEANIFVQLRALNRGWSEAGRRYRSMESYCAANPGVLCFSRPVYGDPSARPVSVDFGILMRTGDLWVERFSNQSV